MPDTYRVGEISRKGEHYEQEVRQGDVHEHYYREAGKGPGFGKGFNQDHGKGKQPTSYGNEKGYSQYEDRRAAEKGYNKPYSYERVRVEGEERFREGRGYYDESEVFPMSAETRFL
jgi:hypothetical protein